MPQMKPMNWFMLFMLTNLILLFLNIMNYFQINMNLNNKKKMIHMINNWKW